MGEKNCSQEFPGTESELLFHSALRSIQWSHLYNLQIENTLRPKRRCLLTFRIFRGAISPRMARLWALCRYGVLSMSLWLLFVVSSSFVISNTGNLVKGYHRDWSWYKPSYIRALAVTPLWINSTATIDRLINMIALSSPRGDDK